MNRRLLLLLAIFLSAISVALWSTGGFATSVLGIRMSARSPATSAGAAALASVLWLVAAWRARAIAADLSALDAWMDRRAAATVATVSALSGASAVHHHTFSASGADPSGYLSEAAMLASGALSYTEPLMGTANWMDAARTLAPLGWQATHGATQVPTYAVGLPLLMTLPHALAGAIGASLVVCTSAALAVWFTGRMAQVLGGGGAGVFAAVSLATLPVQLFESIQPMSDVPVTAAWLGCWWYVAARAEKPARPFSNNAISFDMRAGPFPENTAIAAGVAAALAVLIRPNLAPLAAVPAVLLWRRSAGLTRTPTLWFALPVAAAGVVVAYLHWRWFGSPLRSGYGSVSEIYSLSNIAPNLRLYFQWLLDTNSAWLLAAPLALTLRGGRVLRWLLAFAALVCVAYFVYGTFEIWTYLRFLLPALAIACIATSVVVAIGLRALPAAARGLFMIALTLAVAALQIRTARELDVFTLAARQARAVVAGRYLASVLPERAALITGEQSGAMRYYTGRSIVRWDFLDAGSLLHVERRLAEAGRDVWIVLDDWEVALYREKFKSTAHAGLDWPAALDAGSTARTQAWRLRDRAPFLRGERVVTDRVR